MKKLKDKYGHRVDSYYKYKSPIGIIEVLCIILAVLKITNVIDWSWWWVLAPFWLPYTILCVAFFLVVFLLTAKWLWSK